MSEPFELNPGLPETSRATGGPVDGSASRLQDSLRPEEEEGLLLVKLTPHRIAVVIISLTFILAKGITAYYQQVAISITLDVVFGLLSLELWWISLYDPVDRSVWRWWFHTDHSRRVLDSIVTVLTFGTTYGAVTLSWYLVVLISRRTKIVGTRAVVITITIFTAVTVTTAILTLYILRTCAKRRLRYDPRVITRFNILWGCSVMSAVGLWLTTFQRI